MRNNIDLSAALAHLDEAIATASPVQRAGLVVALAARLATLGADMAQEPASILAPDRNLDIKETSRRMGVSERYLYRHAKNLPFTVREGRRLLFSERGLASYLERARRNT